MAHGKVYLIGAGPGDPGLLTLKGKTCLERADAVVYDRLLSPRLLNFVRSHADLYYVGKARSAHTLPQEKINELLVQLASEGKTVVRLKGGDPFVFGRGGEEIHALADAGLDWEVVPGITSSVSVPAYAGIPVTHRNVSTSFTVLTGHECAGKSESQVDWDALAKQRGTLVILMGVNQLPNLVANLLAAGKPKDTKVALVRSGSRSSQETLHGSLCDIVELVEKAQFRAPAVIVIGEVVGLSKDLSWAEKRPLFGRKLIVSTQTARDAENVATELELLGAEVFDFAVENHVVLREGSLDDVILRANLGAESLLSETSYKTLVFSTALGVNAFFRRLRERKTDLRKLHSIQLVATNQQAYDAASEFGVFTDIQEDAFERLTNRSDVWFEANSPRDVLGSLFHWKVDSRRLQHFEADDEGAPEFLSIDSPLAQSAVKRFLPQITTWMKSGLRVVHTEDIVHQAHSISKKAATV